MCSELIRLVPGTSHLGPHHQIEMAPGKMVFRMCRSHGMRRRISELIAFGPPPRQFKCSTKSPCIIQREPVAVPVAVRIKPIKIVGPVAVANRMGQIAAPDNNRPTIKFRINKKRSMHRPTISKRFARNVLQPAHQPLANEILGRSISDDFVKSAYHRSIASVVVATTAAHPLALLQ